MKYATSSEKRANLHVDLNRYAFNMFPHLFIIKSNFHRLDWEGRHLNVMPAAYDHLMAKVILSKIVFLRAGTYFQHSFYYNTGILASSIR